MKIHPNEPALAELLGQLASGSLRVLEHVLDCDRCRERTERLLAASRSAPPRDDKLLRLPEPDLELGPILDRLAHPLLDRHRSIERERLEARSLLPALLACPPVRRELLLRNSARYQSWGMLELLLEEGREATFEDPRQVEPLAKLALVLADHLDEDRYGAAFLEDMRARAWSSIANARRIGCDYDGAEEAFQAAFAHLRQGTANPVERALLLDLKASLRKAQMRFDEAIHLLRRAIDVFRQAGEMQRAGKSMISLANAHDLADTPEEAIPLLYEAMSLIDGKSDPRLYFFAKINLLFVLTNSGRYLEAQRLALATEPLFQRFSYPWAQNRRLWILGRIARGLGQLDDAERLLVMARDGFLADGAAYDMALVSLELASLYREQGRRAEVRPLAMNSLSFFESLQIQRQVQVALSLLRSAEGGG